MSFSFNTNITDVVKGFIAIALFVLAVIYLPKVLNRLDNIGKPLDETAIQRITENLVKVNLEANNKMLKVFIKELKENDSQAIKTAFENNETIKELGTFIANMKGKTDPDPDIIVTPSGDPDGARDLEEFILYRDDAAKKPYPVGIVRSSPNVKEGPKVSYQTFPLDFKANIVSAEAGEEEKRYVEVWVENNFVKGSKGQKHPIELKEVKWAMAKPNEKAWSWNPRLSFGASFTNNAYYPSLGMSLLSYGRTDRDMDWKFFNFSFGGDSNNFFVDAVPFEWNLGNRIPLVENLFMGPNISYGVSLEDETKEDLSYGLKFSVPF